MSMTWRQISGDVGAAEHGAVFLGHESVTGWTYVLEILPPTRHAIYHGPDMHRYLVVENSYEEQEIADDNPRLQQAIQDIDDTEVIGLADPVARSNSRYLALFEYWGGDWSDDTYRTLKLAMDHYEIPAEALWDPTQYDAPNPDFTQHHGVDFLEGTPLCHPAWDNHTGVGTIGVVSRDPTIPVAQVTFHCYYCYTPVTHTADAYYTRCPQCQALYCVRTEELKAEVIDRPQEED